MKRVAPLRSTPSRAAQKGYALILMLVLVSLGVLYGVFSGVGQIEKKIERSQQTSEALVQAKEALIGYAMTYRDNNNNQVFGYLPCPDTDGDGAPNPPCGTAGTTEVGLLPYEILGLPSLRNSATEGCLWYVVSGNFKNNPPSTSINPLTNPVPIPLNWDTRGRITVVDAHGNVQVTPNDINGGVAAAIIAAGPPLPGQSRTVSNNDCGTTPTLAEATNYIESTIAATGVTTLTDGEAKDANGNIVRNDRLLAITPNEIFSRIITRGDFATVTNDGITSIQNTLNNAIPAHPPSANNNLPTSNPFGGGTSENNFYDNWKNNFRYMTCASGTYCYEIDAQSCDGVLLYSGQAGNATPRPGNAVLSDYFEGVTPADALSLLNGTSFAYSGGAAAYLNSSRAADVVRCLTPQPASARTVSFTNNLSQFTQTESRSNIVTPSIANNRVRLGNATTSAGYGCFWYPEAFPMRDGIRVYFQFRVPNPATNFGSFTFAIADAVANPSPDNMCGASGEYLGFAGNNGVTAPINFPKLGIEFDKIWHAVRNDPVADHAAFLYWGNRIDNTAPPAPITLADDNQHGAGGGADPVNPFASPGLRQRAINRNTTYHVRLEVTRNYNSSTQSGAYTLRTYITSAFPASCTSANFSNLNSDLQNLCPTLTVAQLNYGDLSNSITIDDISNSPAMRQVYLGFTTGQLGQNQRVDITNFSATAR